MRNHLLPQENKGQVLVIFAVSLLVLLVFIGLAIDGSQLFLNYTRLKRAVDASAVAAANDFKRGSSLDRMEKAALEILLMHQIDTSTVSIRVFMCDADGDGNRDASLATDVPEFYKLCPATGTAKEADLRARLREFAHLLCQPAGDPDHPHLHHGSGRSGAGRPGDRAGYFRVDGA